MEVLRNAFLLFVLVVLVVNANTDSDTNVCTSKGCQRAAQKIIDSIDTSVNPCDNFYRFACGGFINSTIIPPDKVGVTPYTIINDELQERLRDIFEEDPLPNEIKPFAAVKRFYKACTDVGSIESDGLKPIKSLIQSLGGWPVLDGEKWKGDNFDWKNTTIDLKNSGLFYNGFIAFGVDNHLKNASIGILAVDQADIGIYQEVLSQGLNNSIVEAYYKLMTNVAVIFGVEKKVAEKEMLAALNLEIDIAKISVPSEKLRDINLLYNPTTLSELEEKYPSIPWIDFANRLFKVDDEVIEGIQFVNVQQPKFISDLIKLLEQTPVRVQANYAMWRAVKSVLPYLTEEILQEILQFEKLRIGLKDRKQRWQECVSIMTEKVPILSGAMYVRKHFTPEARDKVIEIVNSIQKVFAQILKDIEWMDDVTKKHAEQKANNMLVYVGYSNELLDDKILEDYYSDLQLNSGSLLQLGLNTSLFSRKKSSKRLREILQRSDWRIRSTPAVINAFYSLNDNAIEFPAGILQDVYFDENRPRYINFGGIGFLIGHEITHGFDDQGRQFDEHGNLIDWWDKDTNDAFIRKAKCIIDQYSNYTVTEVGLQINGVSSQGENIADNGGIKESYLAYQQWVKQHSAEPKLPGLNYTPNQLFWISAANIWCSNYSPEFTRLLVLTNAHCPNEFRVLGAFQNNEHFANDFKCPLGSPMNPTKKCSVW